MSVGAFAQPPQAVDTRLRFQLFAEHPDIMTPIGMVVDDNHRVFVVESHTHLPPTDYSGPKSDRIKLMVDSDGDGKADRIQVFAKGFDAAMNLALSPQGVLYVVCARAVYALPDRDQDGICDKKVRVLTLETEERYPHNCLLSICFSNDGWLYVGRGNLSSRAYRLVGTDGSSVAGYGDGGNIVRCRADGASVEEWATGFWNPFDIKFDRGGRLICVDNDPDARGPNRLIDVVFGGHYGFISMYGGGGNHPYQSWNGEVPGTLPFASGTGEAPSGVMDSRRTSLPPDYDHAYLVTVWNENTIELHRCESRGVSIQGRREVLIQGDKFFRPVAIDADRFGNVYVTDWVDVAYPNHGRGRIWKLSNASDDKATPQQRFGDRAPRRYDRLLEDASPDAEVVLVAATDDDPFMRHAATVALARPTMVSELPRFAGHAEPRVRLAALLAAKCSKPTSSESLARGFLADEDERVRRAALQWIGQARMVRLRGEIDQVLRKPDLSRDLFEVYLATVTELDTRAVTQFEAQSQSKARDTRVDLPDGLAADIVRDESLPIVVRALAIGRLPPDNAKSLPILTTLLGEHHEELVLASLRRLLQWPHELRDDLHTQLLAILQDATVASELRCEVLQFAAKTPESFADAVIERLEDPDRTVALQAARSLRYLTLDDQQRQRLQATLQVLQQSNDRESDRVEHLSLALNGTAWTRPESTEAWIDWAEQGGDALAGRHVFFSLQATCSKCHSIDGTGGVLGPDLSQVAASIDREQIIRSVLRPSEKFPPQYQAWQVITTDGQVHSGIQLDHKSKGAIEMMNTEGRTIRFEAQDIDGYLASPNSLMPAGLEQTMTRHEFRDLMAFLSTLR